MSEETKNSDDNAAESNTPAADGAADIVNITKPLKDELEKAKKDFLYLMAEFDNYKKNAIKERSDMRKYGAERLMVDLLQVLDIFETALDTPVTPENLADFRKGIEMTAQQLRTTLTRHGLEEIPAQGQPFDPAVHEALSSESTADVPAGHVARVFKKPYRLFDRVVRPGQVVVAKKPE